ncbi:MAG: His/Gly/Thr/Pro-type tRNA ligase C-terminal domain-containing protein, partial [Patescibacteria group bacterium]
LRNKPELVKKAQEIYQDLKKDFVATFDDRGNIGKRYYSQDEIGTPFCVTVDFETLENDSVTVRYRDTMKQERIKVSELKNYLNMLLFK